MKGGMEHVTIRTDRDDPSPGELKGYFAEVFADLDANPRRLMVAVDVHNDRGALASIAFEDGEPVFRIEGRRDVCFSTSVTTRAPRPGEQHGREYFFITQERFDEMAAAGELLEHAGYVNHSYGTPRGKRLPCDSGHRDSGGPPGP